MLVTILVNEGSLELEVSGYVTAGTSSDYDSVYCNWLPGDPADVKDLKVTISKSNRTLDLTDVISSGLRNHYEEMLIEENVMTAEGGVA